MHHFRHIHFISPFPLLLLALFPHFPLLARSARSRFFVETFPLANSFLCISSVRFHFTTCTKRDREREKLEIFLLTQWHFFSDKLSLIIEWIPNRIENFWLWKMVSNKFVIKISESDYYCFVCLFVYQTIERLNWRDAIRRMQKTLIAANVAMVVACWWIWWGYETLPMRKIQYTHQNQYTEINNAC